MVSGEKTKVIIAEQSRKRQGGNIERRKKELKLCKNIRNDGGIKAAN